MIRVAGPSRDKQGELRIEIGGALENENTLSSVPGIT